MKYLLITLLFISKLSFSQFNIDSLPIIGSYTDTSFSKHILLLNNIQIVKYENFDYDMFIGSDNKHVRWVTVIVDSSHFNLDEVKNNLIVKYKLQKKDINIYKNDNMMFIIIKGLLYLQFSYFKI